MDSWPTVRLGDLLVVKHGYAFKGEFFRDEPPGDILLTPGNFAIGGGFKSDKLKYYDGEVPDDFVLIPGDLLITMTDLSKTGDTLGYPARVPEQSGQRFLHNQRIGRVAITQLDLVDPRFVYYVLCSRGYRSEVLASATGSTVRHTSPSRIGAYSFRLPPIYDQARIGWLLSAVDSKVEVNRRMNRSLEEVARVLFKSWFVNFDPMRTRMTGRDLGDMGAVAAHFSDVPKGGVPRGWQKANLGDLVVVLETGGRPKGGVKGIETGVPSVGAESIVGIGRFDFAKTKLVPDDFFASMSKGHVMDRDVLLYKDGGRPGEYEPHVSMFGDGFPFDRFCINEHVYRLRTAPPLSQEFLYFSLESEPLREEMRKKGTGVAIPGLNSAAVRSLTVLVPPSDLLARFDQAVRPLVSRIFANASECRTLSTLRDVLLPKLLSGELRIRDAERAVEAVA